MGTVFKVALVFNLVNRVTSKLGKITGELSEVEKKFKKAGAAAGKMGGAMLAVSGSFAMAASSIEDVQAPLRTVITYSTNNFRNMEEAITATTNAAMAWSRKHRQSATEYLKASYMMSSAGLKAKQAIEGTKIALSLATATMGDSTDAANLMGLSYNNFGNRLRDPRIEMERLGDTVAKTQQLFQIANLNQLNEGLKYASPSAIAAKVSFEEMNNTIGMFNTVGLQGSMAGTAFSEIFNRMSRASRQLGFNIVRNKDGTLNFIKTLQAIKRTGRTSLDDIQKAFGRIGGRGINLLLPKINDLVHSFDKIKNSNGTLKQSVKAMENTFSSKLKVLKNNVVNLAAAIGKPLINALTPVIKGITNVVQGISGWIKANPAVAAGIGHITTGLGAVLVPLGAFLTIYMKLKKLTSSMILKFKSFAGTIFKLGKGFVSLVPKVGAFMGKMGSGIWSAVVPKIKSLGSMVFRLGRGFISLIPRVISFIATMSVSTWSMMISKVKSLIGAVVSLGRNFVSLIPKIGAFIATMAASAWTAIVSFATAIWGAVTATWAFTVALLANPITWIVLAIVALIAGIALLIVYWEDVKEAFISVWEAIKDAFKDAWDFMKGVFESIVQWFEGAINSIKNIITSIGDFISDLFEGIWEGIKAVLRMIVNPVIAVINFVIKGLNKLSFTLPSWVPIVGGKTVGFNIAPIKYLERGTRNFAGGMAIVGERGPELVSLPGGTAVHSNRKSKEMLGSGGSSQVYSINIERLTVQSDDIKSAVDFINMLQAEIGV